MLRNKTVLFLLIVAFMLRAAYIIWVHAPAQFVLSDVANYVRIAKLIGHGQWDAFHFFQPIGFPYLLHLFQKFFGDWAKPLAWFQVFTSTLTCYIMWKISYESWGEKVAKWILIFSTLHFPWIIYNGYGLSESLYTFGLSCLLFVSSRVVKSQAQSAGLGIAWGLTFIIAFLIKGNHAFFGPLFLLSLLRSYKSIASLKSIVPICFVVGVSLFLHGVLAYKTTGKFLMTPTASGLNFVEGKCPSKRNIDKRGILWVSPLYYQLHNTNEKRWPESFDNSSYFMKEGFKCIKKDPFVLVQSVESIFFLFVGNFLWPANQLKFGPLLRLYELLFAFIVIPGLIMFGINSWKTKNKEEFLIWGLPILSLFLCVYIFKSEIRFRLPFDVFIIPAAIRGWFLIIPTKSSQHPLSPIYSEPLERTDP